MGENVLREGIDIRSNTLRTIEKSSAKHRNNNLHGETLIIMNRTSTIPKKSSGRAWQSLAHATRPTVTHGVNHKETVKCPFSAVSTDVLPTYDE